MKQPYGVDEQGMILSQVSLERVTDIFLPPIERAKSLILEQLGDKLHSLYLYGSVATGKAQQGVSDLDLLVLLKETADQRTKETVASLENPLSKEFAEYIRDVGISCTSIQEVQEDLHGMGCFMKHLCVCLEGEDFRERLKKFRPSLEVARAFNGNVGKHVDDFLDQLAQGISSEQIKKLCKGTMRKVVRTGFSLVMAKEQSWTTELKKSCEVFGVYYPDQREYMEQALLWAKDPVDDVGELREFLERFGGWLKGEVVRVFSPLT